MTTGQRAVDQHGYFRAAGELLRAFAGTGDPGVIYRLQVVVGHVQAAQQRALRAAMRQEWSVVAREREEITRTVARFAATVAEAETNYEFFNAIDLGEDVG